MKKNSTDGFALVAALFLIVVLAALGLFAVRVSSNQQQSINLDMLGDRALAAARAGIEYGRVKALASGCPIAPANLNLTQVALKSFTVNITCASTQHKVTACPLPGNICTVYQLTSIATYSTYGKPDFVSRQVIKAVTNVPPT